MKNTTHVAMILDRSGSMGVIRAATVEAFDALEAELFDAGQDIVKLKAERQQVWDAAREIGWISEYISEPIMHTYSTLEDWERAQNEPNDDANLRDYKEQCKREYEASEKKS